MNGKRTWNPASRTRVELAEPLDDEGVLLRDDDRRLDHDEDREDREDDRDDERGAERFPWRFSRT